MFWLRKIRNKSLKKYKMKHIYLRKRDWENKAKSYENNSITKKLKVQCLRVRNNRDVIN